MHCTQPVTPPRRKSGPIRILALAAVGTLALGCAKTPIRKPINEANRPVFHTTHQLSLGAEAFRTFHGGESEVRTERKDFHWQPTVEAFVNVTPWAGYHMLPVFWTFLLTGEQYADSSRLRVGRLHAAASGGLSGLAYSQRDGFSTRYEASLLGKYLFTPRLFATAVVHGDMLESNGQTSFRSYTILRAGLQAWGDNSVTLDYSRLRFHLPSGTQESMDGLQYRDGEDFNRLTLRHDCYLRAKHVFGPEIGLGWRNTGDKPALRAGLHYRFVLY
jgi:hypothetical protein